MKTSPEINLKESHPEVCFRSFNNDPLHSKKSFLGMNQRMEILCEYIEGGQDFFESVFNELKDQKTKFQDDDIFDAMVLSLTCYLAKGRNYVRFSEGLNPDMYFYNPRGKV